MILATLLLALAGTVAQAPVRPDVVIFIIDDMADSDVDDPPVANWTPNIQALAAQGVRYRRAYGNPQCSIARDCLIYSRWLGQNRGDACAAPVPGLTHSTGDYNLPDMLDGAGYHTAHFGKWHLGVGAVGPFEMTASLLYDDVIMTVPIGPECSLLSPGSGQYRINDGVGAIFTDDNTIALRDAFIAWWARTPAPRFAVVEFSSAHAPFNYPPASLLPPGYPPCGLMTCTNRKEYVAEIVGVDTAFGQMRAVMGSNAYTIFTSDNGTPGFVAGKPTTGPGGTVATRPDQDPLKVKLSTYEDGVRVPLIIAGPQIIPGESSALVHLIDVMPTIARMIGAKPDPDALIQGKSFAATLIGLPGQREHVFCWNPMRLDRALIERRWKLLTTEFGVDQLYDLDNDPTEINPLPLSGLDYDRLLRKRTGILAGGG